ncbi:MarR family transcriptional regulator [Olsenella sp. An290]|uniref:MarR family winged helix-turn-helix transcriptional regulator n=1 Tax=Olsenella sp. An290 TaxID=1965625 RepID=UPI000B3B0599|nr:MarR family transcriptional regulator [Olsenella sp. An290]OUO33024.1 hypothetical protein B5F84_08825 [Olsenella sp. An290]
MEGEELYTELARTFIDETARIEHLLTPRVRNSTRGETAVLEALRRAEASLAPKDLALDGHISSARVANVLRSLEEKGLIERRPSETDRRGVEVSLTPAGIERADANRAEMRNVLVRYLDALGEHDARELVRIIGKSRRIVEAHVAEGGVA